MRGITNEMVLTLWGLIGGLILFVLFMYLAFAASAPACWQDTLSDLSRLTSFSEKLLGKDEFFLPVYLSSSCANYIHFKDQKGCRDACSDYGENEKCIKECTKCQDANGCIVAVPVKLSKGGQAVQVWNLFRKDESEENLYFRRLKLAFANLFTAYRSEFQFGGPDTRIQGPSDGKIDVCLHFKKSSDSVVYSITKEDRSREACK